MSWGLDDDLKPAFQKLRGELRIPAVIRAAESKRPVIVEKATLDAMIPRTVVSALSIRAMLIIPLLSGGRVMGMMAVDTPGESRTFTSKDIDIAQGIAAHAADAIQRNRMMAELRAMSLVDELTGLYNRRGFFVLARQHLKIADRARRGMLLVFVDLDRLKFINDRLGHREGDRALVNAARILKETFRESDVIARIGGDEFAVLTIDAGPDSAALLARRLRERLDALNAREDRGYRLSVSAGVTRYDPDAPCSVDDLLSRADAAMYGDKRGGER